MKSIKTKVTISILLICLLTVPLSGIIGVHADSLEDRLSQEVITYPSSEEELMPTAMASAMKI